MSAHKKAFAIMTRSEAEDFLFREARLLDTRCYGEWSQLFTRDGLYWVPANSGAMDPQNHISIIYDNQAQLAERLERIESGDCYAQDPPSRTLHFISNVEVELFDQGEVKVFSNLLLYEFREAHQRRLVPVNHYATSCEHRLRKESGEWKIAVKKVVFLNSDGFLSNLTFLI